MAEPDGVDEGTLRGVNADLPSPANLDRLTSEFEGALVELVQADGRAELRPRGAPGDGDVDRGWDGVDEVVPCQCRFQADCGRGYPLGDLDEVVVSRRGVGPAVYAAA